MKHLFIINPAAGKGKTLNYISKIESILEKRNEEYIIEVTQRPGHATEIVKQYTQKDTYRIYSVGGDGTLNEVLNGMAGSDSSLAIIPSGSGNDFIRSICDTDNFEDIIVRTVDGNENLLDLAKVNDKFFINISSMGFDAEAAYNTIKFKRLPFISGKLAYMASVFYTLVKCRSYDLELVIDEEKIRSRSLFAAVANGRYYGGGMLAAPNAELNDGLFDICLVKKIGRLKILKFFPKFIKGKHLGIPEVSTYRSGKIEITCSSEIILNIDGEVEKVRKAVFEIVPKGIKVVTPQNQAF